MEQIFKDKKINDYIRSVAKDKNIILNDSYSLKISEDYIETSYEYFIQDISEIDLIYRYDGVHDVKIPLFQWTSKGGVRRVPTELLGFDEVFNQIENFKNNFSEEFQKLINEYVDLAEKNRLNKEYCKEFKKIDPQNQAGFSEVLPEELPVIYFNKKHLTRAIRFLEYLNTPEAKLLLKNTNEYYERFVLTEEEKQIEELAENLIEFSEKNNIPFISEKLQNGTSKSSMKLDILTWLKSAEKEQIDQIKTSILEVIDDSKEVEFDDIRKGEKCLTTLVDLSNNYIKEKNLGSMTSQELKNLSIEQLQQKLINQLATVRLESQKERQEFFKYISGFRSSNYSLRNTLLLKAQADFLDCTPVFASMKEWNHQKTSIKPGEHAMLICMPQKFKVYFEKEEDGTLTKLAYTFDKKELEIRQKRVQNGELIEKEGTSYFYKPCIFSIDQTRMLEQDKIKYLQRYNAYNTSTENEKLLENAKRIINGLGIGIQYSDTHAALGFITASKWDTIVLHDDMPVDAQLSCLTHEFGHWLLHRHPDINPDGYKNIRDEQHPYALMRHDMEIQAQLFSHIVLEGLGVDSESEYSAKYISTYLANDEKTKKAIELTDCAKDVLYAHLNIVYDVAKTVTKSIAQEAITEQEIEHLKSFMPDRYVFDKVALKASIILDSDIRSQAIEADAKNGVDNKKPLPNQPQPKQQLHKMRQQM